MVDLCFLVWQRVWARCACVCVFGGVFFLGLACSSTKPTQEEPQVLLKKYRQELAVLGERKVVLEKKITDLRQVLSQSDSTQEVSTPVTFFELVPTEVYEEIEGRGEVRSDRNVTLSAELAAQVRSMPRRVGESVKKGELLVRLNTDLLQASLNEMNNELDFAKLLYERQKALWEKEIGTEIDYLQAENRYQALVRRRQSLLRQIALGSLRAPFAGTIEETFINEGELAVPGQPMLRLLSPYGMYIHAEVSVAYQGEIKIDNPVRISLAGQDSTQESMGRVVYVSRALNKQNQTYAVRILPSNKNLRMRPSQSLVLRIENYRNPSALVVPSRLVQRNAKGTFLFRVAAYEKGLSRAELVSVKTRTPQKGKVEVVEGVQAGDLIIDQGALGMTSGALVEVAQKSS